MCFTCFMQLAGLWIGVSFCLFIASLRGISPAAAQTMSDSIHLAQQNDPWLLGSRYREESLAAQSIAAATLPDPVVSLGMANLPTDTFEFDQEAMTQFKVGLTQTIPRGNSRALASEQLVAMAAQYPYQREARRATVARTVSALWLQAYLAAETMRLIEADRALFEELVALAESRYAAAHSTVRQQDVVSARLELSRLEHRLLKLDEQLALSRASLAQWLWPTVPDGDSGAVNTAYLQFDEGLPGVELARPDLANPEHQPGLGELAALVREHPTVKSIDARIDAGEVGVSLAQQRYKPQWQLNASYGYRDDMPGGDERADFFSVGVALDMPLFTANRQDQHLSSAVAEAEAVRTERALVLRALVSALQHERARLLSLNQRRALYQDRLLTEARAQSQAALKAYTHREGEFDETLRARIDELNTRIDALAVEVERAQAITQINYYLTQSQSALHPEHRYEN